MNQQLLNDLAKAKATFQLKAVQAAMGIPEQEDQCETCGDHHENGVPFGCENGDGY